MKVYMKSNREFKKVFENDWKERDLYIIDTFHHAGCWGYCYGESDLRHLLETRKLRSKIDYYEEES